MKHFGIRLLGWLAIVAGFAVAAALARVLITGRVANGWMLLGDVLLAAMAAYLIYIGRRAVLTANGQQPPKAQFGYGRILLGAWLIFSSASTRFHFFPTRQAIKPLEASSPAEAVAMNATDIAICIGCVGLILSGIWNFMPRGDTRTRFRALFFFISSGGSLLLLAPSLIHEAAIKGVPWFIPIIVIPLYAIISYGAYKRFWPGIAGRVVAPPQGDDITGQK